MPAETLVAIFVGVETVFGAERVAREPSLGPDVVRVVVRGIRLDTQILALLDHHRAAHGHATPVGRSAVALDGHEAIVDVPVVVYYKHQARVPGRREAVQDRVGVAKVVTSLLGIETAIAIIEFTHALVKFVVAAGSPVRDLPPTATGMDAGREVGIEAGRNLGAAAAAAELMTAETTLVLRSPTIVGLGVNMHGRPHTLLQVHGTQNAHSAVVRRALVAITDVQAVVR